VVADTQCATGNYCQFSGGRPTTEVSREVDLSGAASAILPFSYRRSAGENGGNITVEASNNGRTTWTILQTSTMNGSDVSQVPPTFDLTAYIAPNAQVRFVRAGSVMRLYFTDKVENAWELIDVRDEGVKEYLQSSSSRLTSSFLHFRRPRDW